jgi:hypothetical protein
MKLVILGGTCFLGARSGNTRRGGSATHAAVPRPQLSGLVSAGRSPHADGNGDISVRDAGSWNAVIDTSTYLLCLGKSIDFIATLLIAGSHLKRLLWGRQIEQSSSRTQS